MIRSPIKIRPIYPFVSDEKLDQVLEVFRVVKSDLTQSVDRHQKHVRVGVRDEFCNFSDLREI